MSKFVDRPRYTCALGGALATLRAIPRAIPIIHASGGCGHNLFNAMNAGGGYIGGGYCGGSSLPSSNVVERDIVFGGDDRLREQIKTTLEVMDGDLYVVLTGCMVEMIGDDVRSVTAEFANEEKPVLAVPTPSFRGNSFTGYELIMQALAKSFIPKVAQKVANKVNILGIVPIQDVFWKGNLKEIKRVLERLGLVVNTFFGEEESLETIKNAGEAAFNIVVSNLYGVDAAKTFEEVHQIPYIQIPFPIGSVQSEAFLKGVGEKVGIDPRTIEKVIEEEKEIYYDYLDRLADIYNDIDLQRYAIVVGDANYAPAATRFIADELGWLPELTVITDFVDEYQIKAIEGQFESFESGIVPVVEFDTDTSSVKKYLKEVWPQNHNQRYYDGFSPAVIIGSSFERDLANEFGLSLTTISYPVTNRIVLNRTYAGFIGGLTLVEDLLTQLVAGR